MGDNFSWFKIVWGDWNLPKHSFIAWQICSNILQTQDRLMRKNVLDHSCYYLCNQFVENCRHLFFNCNYSKEVLSKVKETIGLSRQVLHLETEWNLIIKQCKGKSKIKNIFKVLLCTTLHELWRERNNMRFK